VGLHSTGSGIIEEKALLFTWVQAVDHINMNIAVKPNPILIPFMPSVAFRINV
jgi:hypothetical protein